MRDRKINHVIDELSDAMYDTQNSLDVLMAAYDALAARSVNELLDDELIELSRQIHRCQDTLQDLKYRRDGLIDLLFR